jgi:HK97 gp10 family phage protein
MARSRVENRQRLGRKLATLPERAKARIAPALASAADEMVDLARRLAPKKTGRLRESIRKEQNGLVTRVTAGGGEAFYARFVEFGTAPRENKGMFAGTEHPGTLPQPFFFPAYRAMKKKAARQVKKAAREAAREVARGGG